MKFLFLSKPKTQPCETCGEAGLRVKALNPSQSMQTLDQGVQIKHLKGWMAGEST